MFRLKFNRNSACWCGSGMKYKTCHMAFDDKIKGYSRQGILVPSHDIIKTPKQIEGIRKAGKLNTMVLVVSYCQRCSCMCTL